ncbi:hypothetical protein SAMN05444008_104253 [Cnuella takakiae]|uniref:Glycosyltransferase 2-like domain-containing protein n=1 Tax=Cnuella takakiae TaxID=1302690 RepID=A0A1M4YEH8_9BACT|nr:glycosyltransferase family 2 protein [Cnuella takakiae]OLY93128.1 hypothetical protein BUE76_15445 [Cnuella takakiae]SHF04129.1 hypothetical protein SAMN05444008_104253 [Cnuella takakiae]
MPQVLVIIINYKAEDLLPGVLKSLQEEDGALSIAILDNSSTDASWNKLKSLDDDRVQLFRSASNLGFTGGINFVLRSEWVEQQNFPYFFLLNPDAYCPGGLVGNLVSLLQQHANAACISPRITHMDGRPWYEGATIQYSKGKVVMDGMVKKQHGRVQETDVFNGCAALFDMHKVVKAGLFNEALFMYYDEADLSIKLTQLGYTILYAPHLIVKHDVSYTTRKISHLKTYYMTRNKFLVFNNTMSTGQKLLFLAHELALHGKHLRIKNMLFHMKGYIDFTLGRTGAINQQS